MPVLCPSCHTVLARDVVACQWLEALTGERHNYGRCATAARPVLVATLAAEQPWEDIDT